MEREKRIIRGVESQLSNEPWNVKEALRIHSSPNRMNVFLLGSNQILIGGVIPYPAHDSGILTVNFDGKFGQVQTGFPNLSSLNITRKVLPTIISSPWKLMFKNLPVQGLSLTLIANPIGLRMVQSQWHRPLNRFTRSMLENSTGVDKKTLNYKRSSAQRPGGGTWVHSQKIFGLPGLILPYS